MLSFNRNCTHLVPIHIKITSAITLERTPSDTSYQKYVALVALLFSFHLVNFTVLHYTPKMWMRSFFFSLLVAVVELLSTNNVAGRLLRLSLSLEPPSSLLLSSSSQITSSSPSHHSCVHHTSALQPLPLLTCASIDFFNFTDYLLLENGQDGVIFAYLFEHNPAVELVAYLLEVISEKMKRRRLGLHLIFTSSPVSSRKGHDIGNQLIKFTDWFFFSLKPNKLNKLYFSWVELHTPMRHDHLPNIVLCWSRFYCQQTAIHCVFWQLSIRTSMNFITYLSNSSSSVGLDHTGHPSLPICINEYWSPMTVLPVHHCSFLGLILILTTTDWQHPTGAAGFEKELNFLCTILPLWENKDTCGQNTSCCGWFHLPFKWLLTCHSLILKWKWDTSK